MSSASMSTGDRNMLLVSAGPNSKNSKTRKKTSRTSSDDDKEESGGERRKEKRKRPSDSSRSSSDDDEEESGGGRRKEKGKKEKSKGKRPKQRRSDGLSLPGGVVNSNSLENILNRLVNTPPSSSSSSGAATAAVAVPPTPAGEDKERKLSRLYEEQTKLLADIRVETDEFIKLALKEQWKALNNRISVLSAAV